jgi:hypothetical protein
MEDEDRLPYRKESERQPMWIIPESLVESVIRIHHDSKWSAHTGIKNTHNWLKSRYWWPRLQQDVEMVFKSFFNDGHLSCQ